MKMKILMNEQIEKYHKMIVCCNLKRIYLVIKTLVLFKLENDLFFKMFDDILIISLAIERIKYLN